MRAVWVIPFAAGLATACLAQEKRAAELIEQLCRHGDQFDLYSCGAENVERRMAAELAALGAAALPLLDGKLAEVEKAGWRECHVAGSLLLDVYAKIAGRAALPAIRHYQRDSPAGAKGYVPADALSLAFGITSYVSDRDESLPMRRCNRFGPREPRDALDAVLVGYLKGDRKWMKAHLGPKGKAALRKLRAGTPKGGEVGYKFEIAGFWGEAGEPLEAVKSERGPLAMVDAPEIETSFVDWDGHRCGSMRIRFLAQHREQDVLTRYLVDSPELGRLLELASGCAARQVVAGAR